MKNLLSILIFAALFQANSTFAQQHDHDGMKMGQEGPAMSEENVRLSDVDDNFKEQLTRVYRECLELNQAFVNSNSSEVIQAVNKVDKSLQQVNMHLLEGNAHMEWMKDLSVIKKNLEKIKATSELSEQRKYFAAFNQELYGSIKTFGLNEDKIYYEYCPMALDNQGAYWLSDTQEIQNPYFGEKMLSCGSVKDVIEF